MKINHILFTFSLVFAFSLISCSILPKESKYERIKIEAKINLMFLHNLENYYFNKNDIYTKNFDSLGFRIDSVKSQYDYSFIEFSDSTFTIEAKAKKDFDKDGQFNLWIINQDKKLIETQKD